MSQQQATESSQTASDYIDAQIKLEADARETLPYQFDSCTKPLGPLRQSVFACLTCTPAPASAAQQFNPAGVCYSCSISCHGEHELVELFCKRDFVCDCGTTRYSNSKTACSLRINAATGRKGDVVDEEPRKENKYNHNFEGKFCGCGQAYNPEKEKGTMFQCLGLGTLEDGGCGEDWWHPECIMGLPRPQEDEQGVMNASNGTLSTVKEETDTDGELASAAGATQEEHPLPEGFPGEDDFDHFICYKCTAAFPWIKAYAGTSGFLPAVPFSQPSVVAAASSSTTDASSDSQARKRKAEDEDHVVLEPKKIKSEGQDGHQEELDESTSDATAAATNSVSATKIDGPTALHHTLPQPPQGKISLFLEEVFRDHLCRCPECFPRLSRHPQLLEEEDVYEPPLSESDGPNEHQSVAGRSVNSGSLLERGEVALSSMDRVRAIEGVMAYNHVRDKVKAFLAPFAESGKAVGAEDIKAYFAQLRGDEQVQ